MLEVKRNIEQFKQSVEGNEFMGKINCQCDDTCTCGCQEGKECTCNHDCECIKTSDSLEEQSCIDTCTCGCQEVKKCTCES